MPTSFQRVVIYGRQRVGTEGFRATLDSLVSFLKQKSVTLSLETETAKLLPGETLPLISLDALKDQCDLLIVLGGDGSLLTAAHHAVDQEVPVLGINRGRLGFLADVLPQDMTSQLDAILQGQYLEESRFLLQAELPGRAPKAALNDVVLIPGTTSHMIEFVITIDGQLVCHQRADGLIIATPTGSTAYALSGGGPILHPSLDAIVLVPMFPHTLSSRPIVVSSDAQLQIQIAPHIDTIPLISCDGTEAVSIAVGAQFSVKRKSQRLRLIHPLQYNYYETLRSKLKWESK